MVKVRVIKAAVINTYTLHLMFKMENNYPGSEPRALQGHVDKPSDKRRGPLFFKPPERAPFVLNPRTCDSSTYLICI